MKLVNKQLSNHSVKVDYFSELRDWMQHVILEAKKNQDLKKNNQFLRLIKEL